MVNILLEGLGEGKVRLEVSSYKLKSSVSI